MQPIQFFAARAEDGALVPGATVDVFVTGTQTRAALFADSMGTVPLINPMLADKNARVFFYSAITRIDIQIHRGAYVGPLMRDVVVTDPDDVLTLTNGLYRTIAQGLSKTVNGQIFQVISPEDEAAYAIYENVAGTAVDTGKRVPARYLLDKVAAEAQLNADAARAYAEGAQAYAGRNFGPMPYDPSTNPLGDPLVAGDRYFNSTTRVERVFDGAAWYTPNADGQAIQQAFASANGMTLIGTPEHLAGLRQLAPPSVAPGRSFVIFVSGHSFPYDGGESNWYWQGNSNEADDNAMVVKPAGYVGTGRWKRAVSCNDEIFPEFFGVKGNYSWATKQGNLDTVGVQAALCWCNRKGAILRPKPGKKYLVDTLYLYYDAIKNPGWTGRAGRVSIFGHANGHATGALENPGSAFVHVDGSAAPLLDLKGTFSVENPAAMGGYFSLINFILVGGNATTHVFRMQGSQGSILLQNYGVKVQNPAGNGITESTTWEVTHMNGLIRGDAVGDGSWSGYGLRVMSDGTDGQTNMKNYINVNCTKMGYGTRIGRGTTNTGTFGPLNFAGGQTSLCDHHGLWLEGGVIAFTSVGYQHEGHRMNGIRIDRTLEDGVTQANDISRSIKIINSYVTGCGLIEDGTVNSYAIYVANGDGVELDSPVFNTVGNGIAFDAGNVDNLLIRRPTWRTVRPYGAAFGYGIRAFGTQSAAKRIYLEHPTFNQNPSVQIDSLAKQIFARGAVKGRISFATNSANPSISLGGTTGSEAVRQINFNYSVAVTLANIEDAEMFQEVLITFSNTNVTIPNNRSTFFLDGSSFTPSNSKSILVLYFDGVSWNEVSRKYNA